MNLGDGLLFELENGKPKLILLSYGVDKNSKKQVSLRPKAATIPSSKQLSFVEEQECPAHQQAGRHREGKSKGEGVARSFTSNITTPGGRNATLNLSKAHENHKGGSIRAAAKVKPERHKHITNDDTMRSNWKTAQPQKIVKHSSGRDTLASRNTQSKESMVCLTSEQLQQILNTFQTSSNGHHMPEEQRNEGNQTDSKFLSSMNGQGGEKNQEDSGGGENIKQRDRGESDASKVSVEKDRFSGCLFSWLEEQQPDSRATIDAKKAQWRKELDEQVALKQQRPSPGTLQVAEDRESVLSVRTSISQKELPAAIKSSLKLGEVTPMEELLSAEKREKREEQRRRWLEELDRQREEMSERRKRDKLLQSQTEDHELWANHFDSLQRRPHVQSEGPSAPTNAPSNGSERGEWEPSSSLSLVWEAMSSCGAESVGAASVDTTSGYQTRASYLRSMTALLDPAQIEERERRRLKQLEQQRAIEAQVEERKRQKAQEEASRRKEEEEEERRVAQERDTLRRQYELASVKERHKEKANHQREQTQKSHNNERLQEKPEASDTRHDGNGLKKDVSNSVCPYRDMAVQTEAAPSLLLAAESPQTLPVTAKHQAPSSQSVAPSTSKNRATKTGKENICLQGGGDPYEAFARTDRSRRDRRRPEWNMQRPSRRFVPASERYPAALQRNRQESRLKRQAELVALQERACLARTEPPPQSQDPETRTSPDREGECVSRGQSISAANGTERGRSPPVPAVSHRMRSQQSCSPSPSVLDFIPYVRTDEVFNLDPLEPANTPQQDTQPEDPPQCSASPLPSSQRDPLLQPELLRNTHTHRQQEILRGLAQLRQGLLQKQRELETDLNPLLKHRDSELRTTSASHRM
ncbi:LOW QUALITY PROTEIN: coiled-coil domain-containing protein 66 [Betta splendens]|uniref:LOW QUALITY PROTEIN: coiled-coil domain-containing protein 66 n=1 Tax=Betta splendens TaxID=158456 RepID=A0A6P7MKQ8_BETSP|nr:LOW QUALITY PROTEIN: coiled-coil domain-containing protein 66 [Betta splendens]